MFQRDPGYVAAQAYTLGIIIGECIRRADRLEDRELLAAARGLDTTSLYGRFRLDPSSMRQVGHEILLVEWRDGEMEPANYFLSSLTEDTPLDELVRITMQRWRTERAYEDLLQRVYRYEQERSEIRARLARILTRMGPESSAAP